MNYHVLNGDALEDKFPVHSIDGDLIVWREAFMDGPVTELPDKLFWETRAKFIASEFDVTVEEYREKFVSQFEIINQIRTEDKVFLWFEDDLFCQVNMWFAINLLSRFGLTNLYRVFPLVDQTHWSGFGNSDQVELANCFKNAELLEPTEVVNIRKLWSAYVQQNEVQLIELSNRGIHGIRFLPEVIQAHLDRMPNEDSAGRPQKVLSEIIRSGAKNFEEIFMQFYNREGIYGYGDVQVRKMLMDIGFELEV